MKTAQTISNFGIVILVDSDLYSEECDRENDDSFASSYAVSDTTSAFSMDAQFVIPVDEEGRIDHGCDQTSVMMRPEMQGGASDATSMRCDVDTQEEDGDDYSLFTLGSCCNATVEFDIEWSVEVGQGESHEVHVVTEPSVPTEEEEDSTVSIAPTSRPSPYEAFLLEDDAFFREGFIDVGELPQIY